MPERAFAFSLKLYRLLLRLYPAAFHEDYAASMEREFREELAESRGAYKLAVLWVRLFADLATSLPVQLMSELGQDGRQTLRIWAQSAWSTGFAILALAIGIGASTGVFSVVNAVVLRSLPFSDPSRLVSLQTYLVPHDSANQFYSWQQQSAYLAGAALFEETDTNLGNSDATVRVHISQTSSNFFSLLGSHPVIGRTFGAGEDTQGRNAIGVIGYGLWQQLFAGDRRALGSTLAVNGKPLTIIGVMPPGFDYPGHSALWKAAEFSPGNNGWATVARLRQGIGLPQARAAFSAEMLRLSKTGLSRKYPPKMAPLQDVLAGPVKNASLLLLAAVLLILLVACSNVANLLLARAADRTTEFSIRSALGASRARLAQQLFTECFLLALVSSTIGLVIAFWTVSLAAKVQPVPLGTESYSILNVRVLAFAMAAAILSAFFFGLLPALNAGRVHFFSARGSSGLRSSRMTRELLVVAQVTITIMLLAAAVSATRAFLTLMGMDRGFDLTRLVTVSVSLDGTTRQLAGRQLPYFEESLDRIRRLPGVRAASETEFLPLNDTAFLGGPVGFDGRRAEESSMIVPVLADYFRTMRAHLLYGREFTDAEVRSDSKIAVVNELFARQFIQPENVIGHEVTLGKRPPWRIVGVVSGMDYATEGANKMQVFVPAHTPGGFFSTFVVRVDGRERDRLASIRDAIRSVDTRVPVFGVKTMEQRLDDVLSRPKFYRTAFLFFAGFALLVAVAGIFSVVSYAVVQRVREMGIRLALGTTPAALRTSVLREGLLMVAVGVILGIAGAALTGRVLEPLIEGAGSMDPRALILSALLILATAATCIWFGTRRITKLDIMDILRNG